MANRRQRAARRLEEQDQEQAPEQAEVAEHKEPSASPPAGKPESARKWFVILWGIPLIIFVVIAILKG